MATRNERNAADWRRVEKVLRDRIESGALPPGARLETQDALATEFGVSRHAVRRALDGLAQVGLVGGWQGKGVFVSAPRLRYEAGSRLRFAQNIGAARTDYRVELLRCSRKIAPARIAEMLGLRQRQDAMMAEMLRWIGRCPVAISCAYLDIRRYPRAIACIKETGNLPDAYRLLGIRNHNHVETVFAARLPTAHEAVLLGINRAQPVLVTTALNETAPGQPVDVVEVVWRGDAVEVIR